MLVDFKIKKFSGCRVASITYVGPYREGGDMMREEFNQIVKVGEEEGGPNRPLVLRRPGWA